jgi:hypothetical protein
LQAVPQLRAIDIKDLLSARERLRDMVILSELLQPPLSVRQRRL